MFKPKPILAATIDSIAALVRLGQGAQVVPVPGSRSLRTPIQGLMSLAGLQRHPTGPGWSQAQVQRMARKKRNQARHRAHCKGRK